MGTKPFDDINEGLERIHQMFYEDRVHKTKMPKNPIEAMAASGIDMIAVREASGGNLDNILHAEQIDQTSWRLRVRRITKSGNYTETIIVTANSDVLSESANATNKEDEPIYRLTPDEAVEQVAKTLGNHLIKVEAIRGNDRFLALHIRENRNAQALHRVFAELNESLHRGGWHATMRENQRWTMSPMAGTFLEKRAVVRAAGKKEHLYPPSYYAGRSTDAMLRSSEYRDGADIKERASFEYYEDEEDTIFESDARKRAFKAGYPMVPQHALAHSTDTIMYPNIRNKNKIEDEWDTNDPKPRQDKENMVMNKAVNANGEFL